MGADCKSVAFLLRWFESTRSHQKIPDVKTSGIFLLQNLRLCKNQSLGKRKNTDFGGDVKEKETRELKEF